MKYLTPLWCLAALLVLTSCKGVTDIEVTGADGFEYKGMDNNSLLFSVNIRMHNPSSLTFRIREVNLKTVVDGNYLGTISTNDKIKVPAQSDSSYRVTFNLQLTNLLTGASTIYSLSRKEVVTVEVQGYVKARSMLVVKKVDVLESRVVEVPRIF
jgi:LEA14-like dessication related protein